MTWLKDAYLDLIVLLIIAIYAVFPSEVLEIVIWVYTVLLLVSKVLVLFMPSLQRKANANEVPTLVYNVIYVSTVGLLLYATNYYLSGAWAVIWIISLVSLRSSKKKTL